MFIKPTISNPPVPYNVLVELSRFTPGGYSHDGYQDIAKYYKGIEYFEDDTSFVNVFFGKSTHDIKLFKVTINWSEFVISRKVCVPNIDAIASDVYDHLWWDLKETGIKKDIHRTYYKFLIKVFLITNIEQFIADITNLPCYSDYTWLKEDGSEGVETLDVDKVYVVYE